MSASYFDIHSHLNDKRFVDDLPETLARMRAANVASITVGTDRAMSEKAIALADEHTDLWATIGQHPVDRPNEVFDEEWYRTASLHPRVVAIGECGLDYYWPAHDGWKGGEAAEKLRQRELFEKQIVIAIKTGKPLMIHGRPTKGSMDAYEDILSILKSHPDARGNIHFFVGNTDIAGKFLDLGFTMSFTGVLTFTSDYDEVIRYLPLESIHAETDAPYVAPTPHRGARNEPAYVVEVVNAIARIRGENEVIVRNTLVDNARRVFGLA